MERLHGWLALAGAVLSLALLVDILFNGAIHRTIEELLWRLAAVAHEQVDSAPAPMVAAVLREAQEITRAAATGGTSDL